MHKMYKKKMALAEKDVKKKNEQKRNDTIYNILEKIYPENNEQTHEIRIDSKLKRKIKRASKAYAKFYIECDTIGIGGGHGFYINGTNYRITKFVNEFTVEYRGWKDPPKAAYRASTQAKTGKSWETQLFSWRGC